MKKIVYVAAAALALAACTKEDGVKLDALTITPDAKTVYTDEQLPVLSLTATPENAIDGATVEWTSNDPALVSVSDKGELAFEVKDIEESEKTVTITAKVGEKTAACTLTVKGQIARYEVLDLTADFGFQILDRNVGAKNTDEAGNFYQWGKNEAVAANDDAEVNKNYDAEWGIKSEGFADWTVAENTPCPKGWSLPSGDRIAKIKEYANIYSTYELEWYDFGLDEELLTYSKAEYEDAKAKLAKLPLTATGKFAFTSKDGVSTFGKTTPNAVSFWLGEKTTDAEKGTETVSYYENNRFPTISKGGAFTTAMTVRCVK